MSESSTLPFPHHGEAEEWRPVVGYEGLYDVSSLGRAKSLKRLRLDGRPLRERILRASVTKSGYRTVSLYRDGAVTKLYVHALVAAAFIGPRPEGQEVRHGPLGSGCDAACNLGYGTPWENTQDKFRDGTMRYGDTSPVGKLTEAIVVEARRLVARQEVSLASLARIHGVSAEAMRNAVRGYSWYHVPVTPEAPLSPGRHYGRLAEASVVAIRRRCDAGEDKRALATEYDVSEATVYLIGAGKTWKHLL